MKHLILLALFLSTPVLAGDEDKSEQDRLDALVEMKMLDKPESRLEKALIKYQKATEERRTKQ